MKCCSFLYILVVTRVSAEKGDARTLIKERFRQMARSFASYAVEMSDCIAIIISSIFKAKNCCVGS